VRVFLVLGPGVPFDRVLNIVSQVSDAYKLFYLITEGLALLCCVTIVSMVMVVFVEVGIWWVLKSLRWGNKFCL